MEDTLKEITAQALKLSPKQRMKLAATLLGSVKDSDRHDLLWALEADRRYQDILDGKAKTIPGEEVIASIDAMLAARRRSRSATTRKPKPSSTKR
jgi:putative addiction module component (TIGR02574 family)